jgi:uncharacterized protein YmfQ (DUF2313 family)
MDRTDIITSPEAARMLGMVTKDFYNESYIALWLFEVTGREYDEMAEWSRGLNTEIFPQTGTWSIGIWEELYGLEQGVHLPLRERQKRILAHIIGEAPINPEVIRSGVAALTDTEVTVAEGIAPYTFSVSINTMGMSPDYQEIWRYVRRIKPSHLSFEMLRMILWGTLEQFTWGELEQFTWGELETGIPLDY